MAHIVVVQAAHIPSTSYILEVSCVQCCGAGQVTKVDPPKPQTRRPKELPLPTQPEVQGAKGNLVVTSNVCAQLAQTCPNLGLRPSCQECSIWRQRTAETGATLPLVAS